MTREDLLNSLSNTVTTYLDEGGDPAICADELREIADEVLGLNPITPVQTPAQRTTPTGKMTPCTCGCGGFWIG
jgi:hypothetical protein